MIRTSAVTATIFEGTTAHRATFKSGLLARIVPIRWPWKPRKTLGASLRAFNRRPR